MIWAICLASLSLSLLFADDLSLPLLPSPNLQPPSVSPSSCISSQTLQTPPNTGQLIKLANLKGDRLKSEDVD